jgi:Fic family protein
MMWSTTVAAGARRAYMIKEPVDWINRDQDIHPALVSGISQFQLVHIHPFLNGNGRTASQQNVDLV